MKNKKSIIIISLFIVTIIVITTSITYAYLSVRSVQTTANSFKSGCLNVTFNDSNGSNRINLTNAYPMSDAKGLTTSPYSYSIKNNCSTTATYQVYLNVKNTTATDLLPQMFYSIDGSSINVISNATKVSLPTGASSTNTIGTYLIDSGSLASLNATNNHTLRIWIGEHAGNSVMTKNFEAEVLVYIIPESSANTIKSANLTNLITDPSFEGNNWSIASDSTRAKYGNKSLKITGTTSSAEVTITNKSTMYLNNTHKYYGRFEAYPTISGKTGGFYWPIAEPNFNDGTSLGTVNTWNIVSGINTRSTFTTGYQNYRLDFNNSKTAGSVWYDGVMMIDLTAAFGSGKEPSKAWCDANIPYFEGTKKINYLSLS